MSNLIAKNPTARHNYEIIDTIEAGIVLCGTEIKSIRNGKANLKDSYAIIKNGELYIYNLHISPYEFGNIYNKNPLRDRKLLVSKREINKLIGLITKILELLFFIASSIAYFDTSLFISKRISWSGNNINFFNSKIGKFSFILLPPRQLIFIIKAINFFVKDKIKKIKFSFDFNYLISTKISNSALFSIFWLALASLYFTSKT